MRYDFEDDFDCCARPCCPFWVRKPATKQVVVMSPHPLQYHVHTGSPLDTPGVQHQHGGMYPHTHATSGVVTFEVPA